MQVVTRQANREDTAGSGQVSDGEGACIRFNALPCNYEAQAQACLVVMTLRERLEHLLDIAFSQTTTVVLHIDVDLVSRSVG